MREEVAALKLSVKVIENTAFVCSDCGYIPAQVRCDFLSELLQSYELFVQKGEQYRAVSGTDLLEWSERKASSSRMKTDGKGIRAVCGAASAGRVLPVRSAAGHRALIRTGQACIPALSRTSISPRRGGLTPSASIASAWNLLFCAVSARRPRTVRRCCPAQSSVPGGKRNYHLAASQQHRLFYRGGRFGHRCAGGARLGGTGVRSADHCCGTLCNVRRLLCSLCGALVQSEKGGTHFMIGKGRKSFRPFFCLGELYY